MSFQRNLKALIDYNKLVINYKTDKINIFKQQKHVFDFHIDVIDYVRAKMNISKHQRHVID